MQIGNSSMGKGAKAQPRSQLSKGPTAKPMEAMEGAEPEEGSTREPQERDVCMGRGCEAGCVTGHRQNSFFSLEKPCSS